MTQKTLSRSQRLTLVIERLNQIHCRRRMLGRPTAHLIPRCRVLTAAWLDARHADLMAPI